MPDKLTDSEIVKEFETLIRCANFVNSDYVTSPFEVKYIVSVIDLINRLQAENERLKDENQLLLDKHPANTHSTCAIFDNGVIYAKTLEDYDNLIGDISREGIKEFAERLKERKYLDETGWSHGEHPYIVEEDDIDDVLEELVGD